MAKKADLINELVQDYGWDKEDLKFDSDGKPFTNAKLEALIKAEQEDAKEAEVNKNRKTAPKSKLKDDDRIVVMSGIGSVGYYSERTNKSWKFSEFGQQDAIEYSELLAMKNRYPAYFTQGWIIILDEQVQEEFKLTELYKNILTPENIDKVFEMRVPELEKFIDNMPDSQKTALVHRATEKYEAEELRDVTVIKFLQNKFNFSFEDNAPLNNIVASVDTGTHNIIYVDKN